MSYPESPNDSGYGSGDCYSSDDEDCYGEGSSEGSGEGQHKYKYREEEEEEEGSGWEQEVQEKEDAAPQWPPWVTGTTPPPSGGEDRVVFEEGGHQTPHVQTAGATLHHASVLLALLLPLLWLLA